MRFYPHVFFAVILAVHAAAQLSESTLLSVSKPVYNSGETVEIFVSNSSKNFSVLVSFGSSIYRFDGAVQSPLLFTPPQWGNYTVAVYFENGSIESTLFTVVDKNIIQNDDSIQKPAEKPPPPAITTGKSHYLPGESVTIFITGEIPNDAFLYIYSANGIYSFLGNISNTLSFEPKQSGRYIIKIEHENAVISVHDFEVALAGEFPAPPANKSQINQTDISENSENSENKKTLPQQPSDELPKFLSNESAVIEMDLHDAITLKKSFWDIIFGTTPLDALSFYVQNHSTDLRFNLSVLPVSKERFIVTILHNPEIESDKYTLVADMVFGDEHIVKHKLFYWNPPAALENQSNFTDENAGIKKDEKEVNYSFAKSQSPAIPVDFTSDFENTRDILAQTLRKTQLDALSVFVDGHESDPDFNLSVSHIEYDLFNITILQNQKIPPDIYTLVAIATFKDAVVTKKIPFGWGFDNAAAAAEKAGSTEMQKNESNESDFFIQTDKQTYLLGDSVIIYSLHNLSSLQITHLDTHTHFSTLDFVPNISFAPQRIGVYVVEGTIHGLGKALTTTFSVQKNGTSLNHSTLSFDQQMIQLPASVGKPVTWIRKIVVKNEEPVLREANISFEIPLHATNITIGGISSEKPSEIITRVQDQENKSIEFMENVQPHQEKEITVTYETQPPKLIASDVNSTAKIDEHELIVKSDAQVHYQNVTSSAEIDEVLAEQVHIFWLINGTEVDIVPLPEFNVTLIDRNNNGLIDTVTWIVPQLSEQRFKIKIIKSANLTLGLSDSKNNSIDAFYELYADGKILKVSDNQFSEALNLTLRHSMRIVPKNTSIRAITINDIKEFSDITTTIGVEELDVPSDNAFEWRKMYALNPLLNFTNGTVEVIAKGTSVYKCNAWNFAAQNCGGTWKKIKDVIPGTAYTLFLTPDDPGFAETGVASVNTNKSRYRPDEDVKILMVVLDTGGRLVRGASVELNISNPLLQVTTYSTLQGTIIETETGIYQAIYTDTSLKGNYTLFVHAAAQNVDNSMMSFFSVEAHYPFDIIRDTPVTTDPFSGPFTSKINIISYSDTPQFTFSEVLPINFSILSESGALITTTGDLKMLQWTNLANNSQISYTALPPLITPHLWEIGPSEIGYGTQTFSEGRPWYLAVDPVSPPADTTPRTCTSAWGADCGTLTNDDTYGVCTSGTNDDRRVWDVIINGTILKYGDVVNVTCNFDSGNNNDDWGVYYNDSTVIYTLNSSTSIGTTSPINITTTFTINNTGSVQFVRCVIHNGAASSCPTTGGGIRFDVDDVNFTVGQPIPPQYLRWNVSNGTGDLGTNVNITRGAIITAYALWNTPLNSSILEHNGNKSSINFSDGSGYTTNYTNFTLDTSNTTQFTHVGPFNISTIYAEDLGYYNKTSPELTVVVYGTATISDDSLDPLNVQIGNYSTMLCRVTDGKVNAPYENYNVTYWNNNTGYLGFNLTNSAGWANMTFNNTLLGTNNITCNISASEENYFYRGSTSAVLQQLTVLSPGADTDKPIIRDISATPSAFSTGTIVKISANVTDNINISIVRVNITSPSLTTTALNMNRSTGDIFEVNFTDTSNPGIYTYYIFAKDNASPQNMETSLDYTFEAVGTRAILSIQTKNTTYKQYKEVNLTFSSQNNLGNVQTGNRNLSANPRNTSSKTCSETWGTSCSNVDDVDVFDLCTGANGADRIVTEAYLNASGIKVNDDIKVTCEYDGKDSSDEIEIWYYDGASFTQKFSGNAPSGARFNQSASFTVTSNSRTQWARCIIDQSGEGVSCPSTGKRDFDDINFTVDGDIIDDNGNTSYVNYTSIGNQNYTKISDIIISINFNKYNNSGSKNASNTNPDIEVSVFDGSDYTYKYTCGLNSLTSEGAGVPVNCSTKIKNSTILNAWNNTLLRRMQIRGMYFDTENSNNDLINWSGVFVTINTPSKIENYGISNVSNLSARIVLQVDYNNGSSWNFIQTIYNSSQTVGINQTINLSTFWNPNPFNTQNRNLGVYRATAVLTDSSGAILQDENNINLSDTSEFILDFLKINVQTPLNNSVQDANGFWANVTLNYTSYPSGGFCNYSINSFPSVSMPNDTAVHFYNFTANISEGNHSILLSCNDTTGDFNYVSINFTATDQQPPIVNLSLPPNNDEVPNGNVTFAFNTTDTVLKIHNCTLEFQYADNQTNTSIMESVNQSFKVWGLDDGGPYVWRVRCTDNGSARNVGNSSYYSFIVGFDVVPPIITLRNPTDDYNTSNNDILFDYRVIDQTSSIANCSLVINGTTNQTNKTIVEQGPHPYTFNNFTINDMPDGVYAWSVNCTDTANNHNIGNSSTRILRVLRDTDFPTITLLNPPNDTTDTDGLVTFEYNVTDASSKIANCSLNINNRRNSTTQNPTEGVLNTFTPTAFATGTYNWTINCTDDSFDVNTNISDTRNFSVSLLSNLRLTITTDKSDYEQGTQINDTIEINTTTRDSLQNLINSSAAVQVIFGNTTLSWWNSTYLRRKPLQLNNSIGSTQINVSVEVNITNLQGYLKNCTTEIRIIQNYSRFTRIIPFKAISGDDATYCVIAFFANISSGEINQTNYYAYYNNSGSPDPNYNLDISNRTRMTCTESFNGDCGATGAGTIDDTFDSCNAVSDNQNYVDDVYINATRAEYGDVLNISCSLRPRNGASVFYIYYNNSQSWTQLRSGTVTTSGTIYNESVTLTVNSYGRIQYVRCMIDESGEGDRCADTGDREDNDDAQFFVGPQLSNNSRALAYQRLINYTTNDTGSDGIYTFRFESSGLEQGDFAIIADGASKGYSNTTNYSSFKVRTDITAPTVNLVSPNANNVSTVNNVLFIYNVSDVHSWILNCSLIINGTINQTNTSILEDTRQNFTLTELPNSVLSWTVNCTDNSSNRNRGTASERLVTIAVDTTPPVVTLLKPLNNYTDTNRNVSFNYTVTDDLTTTADCSLYINGTLNTTTTDVTTGASTQTFGNISLFNNGTYEWYVNCTDDSSARNYNISPSQNFTVIDDLDGPIITLITPIQDGHLTNENVTFRYNVSDALSNVSSCSLLINGTLNWTNTTIHLTEINNFSIYNLNGYFNWSINCTDKSEHANVGYSEVRRLLIAPDVTPPVIKLEFPPDVIELLPGNITFKYNVSDFASGISNCSLYINGTLNFTERFVLEDVSQNITPTHNMTNGTYNWYINCSDSSPNYNFNSSEIRNLTIGADQTPPTITLSQPADGYNDSDGSVLFSYQAIDIGSPIKNCSLVINGTINQTNTSVEEGVLQNFSIANYKNGTFGWQVNCTDNSSQENTANSSVRIFTIRFDGEPPLVQLINPPNNTVDTDGNRMLSYNVSDALNGISNCTLIINNKLNLSYTSVVEDAPLNFSLTGLVDGQYNWSVNCTDNSDNKNVGDSPFRELNVSIDLIGPVVTLQGPPNHARDTNGNVTFNYTVSDAANSVSNCTLRVGSQQFFNTSITEGITMQYNITGLTTGDYYWNITCVDNSDNNNSGISSSRNISIGIDNSPPSIKLVSPANFSQYTSNNVTFYYNVSDVSPIKNCTLVINGTLNQSNASRIITDTKLNFTVNDMPNGTFAWRVNCTDMSEDSFANTSEERLVIVGPDVTEPVVSLISPANEFQDTDGNLLFEFNVSDFASSIANCTLVFNGTANVTNNSIQEDATQSFSLFDVGIGNYTWQVNCTDTSPAANKGASEIRNVSIGQDTVPPTIQLSSPQNNSLVNAKDITFAFSAYDSGTNISNCSVVINNLLNKTNNSIANSLSSLNYISIADFDDGDYNWSVNCTDGSNNSNIGNSDIFNMTVLRPRPIITDITVNTTSLESGFPLKITANTTNTSRDALETNVAIDVIFGNTTAPFFNGNWHYRIPVDINTTNVSRTFGLVEIPVNFTNTLINDLGLTGKTFDTSSVRVIEWSENNSIETVYQFTNGSGFNAVNNSHGVMSWILNATTSPQTIRTYFIYFDITDNGQKAGPNYASYKPTISLSGSTKTVNHDGSQTSANHARISKGTESITIMFGNGQDITNQQNIDYQGGGSIWNITVGGTQISNLYDSIIPVSVYNNYFLNQNNSANITSGPVYTKIRIPGYLNGTSGTAADLNYTIWFGQNEIFIRADASVKFTSAVNDPQVIFNNIWFAYLFDYDSDWSSYIRVLNSSEFTEIHRYRQPTSQQFPDPANIFRTTDWYSEYSTSTGSVNMYADKFTLNGAAATKGIVSLDDYYSPLESKVTESDGVGFNFNSDQTIAAGDTYAITVWMVLSANKTSQRALDLKNHIDSPLNITIKKGQVLINRTESTTGSDGLFSFNWSSSNQVAGNYTATVMANKTLYQSGTDYVWFIITPDTIAPLVTAISPVGYINTENTTFFFNVSDTNTVANCSVIINTVKNLTNTSITNGGQNSIILYNMSEGNYNWSVNCTDTTGNTGNSSVKNITIDLTKPGINLSAPAAGQVLNYTGVEFNFSAVDNFDPVLACNLTIDGSVGASVNASNGTLVNVSVVVSQAVHTWNVTCIDDAGNQNISLSRQFTVDLGAPTITLNGPANNSFAANGNITFTFTPLDLSLSNCTLILNGVVNQTNTSPSNGVSNIFKTENRSQEKLAWSVNCTDSQNNVGSSLIYFVYVDFTPPNISLNAPENNFNSLSNNVQLNFTALDNFDTALDCNVSINATVNNTQLLSAANGSVLSYNATGFDDGFFTWNVTCADNANNTNTSVPRNFTVQEAPRILLQSPANATRTNNILQNFTFTPSDNSGSVSNCTLILNNRRNVTNDSIGNNVPKNLTVTTLTHNAYNWTVNCTDPSGNVGTNETALLLFVDLRGPFINLTEPIEGQTFNTDDITFNFTPTDQFEFAINLTCNLTLDGVINISHINVTSGTHNATQILDLNNGQHTWNVTCKDDFNNTNTSATVTFIVNSPDLVVNNSNITFNNTNPGENESILVNATIANIGGIPANNFDVLFYDFTALFGNKTVQTLASGQNITVNATFNATQGFHEILVRIVYGGVELSTDNNNATSNLTILLPQFYSPPNGTWTNNVSTIVNITVIDFANSTLNYTLYLDGILNRTANITDNQSRLIEFNLSEGVHTFVLEGFGPRIDFAGKAAGLSRRKNSTAWYRTADYTPPLASFITLNNSWFNDNTPEIRFNITDNLDSVLNYTIYLNGTANYSNYTTNGTATAVNLSLLGDGNYSLIIEAFDDGGNRSNSSFIYIFIDTAAPAPGIYTVNNSNFSDTTPEIHFNITDNLAPTINYTFFVDSVTNRNGTAQNTVNRTDNLTTLSDGFHRIILQAVDLAGNRANSTFINITIDSTPPDITIDSPQENGIVGYLINILTTVTDSGLGVSGVRYSIFNDSYVYYQNGTLNATTNFDDVWNSSINITEDFEFMLVNLSVTANDTLGNNRTVVRRFIVDNKRPSIQFVVPDGHDFRKNFTLDIQIQNRNLTVSFYNITNATGDLMANNSNASIMVTAFNWTDFVNISNATTFPEGVYNITVVARDVAGNNRTALNFFRIDRTSPNMTLLTPIDLLNTTQTTLDFNFTALDNMDVDMNCNLSIDASIVRQNINATNGTTTNVTILGLDDGVHQWNVSCEDSAGNWNGSLLRNFSIDRAPPAITLMRPANNSFNGSQSMMFFYTPRDNITQIPNCTLIINGRRNQTNYTILKNIENNFTLTNLAESVYDWTVNCTDSAGNIGTNESALRLYIDLTPPNATFITNNGTWFNIPTPEIAFNITDNFDTLINYTLYVDGSVGNVSAASNATRSAVNTSALANGTHTLLLEIFDNAYNKINATNISIIIDTALPNITLYLPQNNSNITATELNFSFNVTDNLDEELLCNLTINSAVNISLFAANHSANTTKTVSGFDPGFYNWSISCMDNATNIGVSVVRYFNITPPDLEISSVDIRFNATSFEENVNFTIFANITNVGTAPAVNALVQIFSGHPQSNGIQLDGNFTLNLSAGQNKTINLSWGFGIGTTTIFVWIDGHSRIVELDETNNLANKTFNVSAYNIVFGNVTGNLLLGDASENIVFSWGISNATAGSIFAVDSDSAVTWSNLSALGINITDGNTSSDFADFDFAVVMQNLSDSLNRTYTQNGRPITIADFVVFSNVINTTPLANSTNTSAFMTGILWDKSDKNTGEYNGSQDIVFISKINRTQVGTYGTYDFEIKVPARLREYIKPNNENSVTFYAELI